MTRAEYLDQRRAIRDAAATRAERGLPKHPDGSGLARCPRCGNEGCSLCDGSTYISDGYRDPLLRLRYARQPWVRRRDPCQYENLRRVCAASRHVLRLIEAAVGCEIAANRALAARRRAA